jgi:hypothetical protein
MLTDEDVNFEGDPLNCGRCKHVCQFMNAYAQCVIGKCIMGACYDGFSDLDGLPHNGCELDISADAGADDYPTIEVCNGLDDDLDGETDEGIPWLGEPCGGPNVCPPGQYECICDEQLSCGPECIGAIPIKQEVCNGQDDDCDGLTDEDLFSGETCSNSLTDNPNEGICRQARETCVYGHWECETNHPEPEICDFLDNDCDGFTDE